METAPDEFDGQSFRPVLDGKKDHIHESLFFEMGYSRAVLKHGFKYLALRYPQHASQMPYEKRASILKEFNARQQERERPIYTRDPNTPFSHISLIPGGGDAEGVSTGKKAGYYDPDQLYALHKDGNEQVNLANNPEHAAKLKELKAELSTYLNSLPGGFAELKK